MAETLLAAAARLLAAAVAPLALPGALTLGLMLASTTPAQAPGLPPLPPSRDELRLRELVAKHAAGTLAADEEAELVALLATVKGIHVASLRDLDVEGPLYGNMVPLPGFHYTSLAYTKRTTADSEALRVKFRPVRVKFLKDLAADPTRVPRLKQAGVTDKDLARMALGKPPIGWQVHHKLPLDDGGDNSVQNLLLIKGDPYHKALTNYQLAATHQMKPGETRVMQWPIHNGYIHP